MGKQRFTAFQWRLDNPGGVLLELEDLKMSGGNRLLPGALGHIGFSFAPATL